MGLALSGLSQGSGPEAPRAGEKHLGGEGPRGVATSAASHSKWPLYSSCALLDLKTSNRSMPDWICS